MSKDESLKRKNGSSIPEHLKPLIKDDMTRQDYALIGNVILKEKIDNLKFRITNSRLIKWIKRK